MLQFGLGFTHFSNDPQRKIELFKNFIILVLDGDLMETMYEWPSESEPEAELKKKDVNVFHKK